MKIVDISNEIYLENNSPPDTSISAISFWIRSSIGKLNLLLYEDFYVDFKGGTYEILKPCCAQHCFGHLAAAIMKLMYQVYRTDLDIRNTIMGISRDSVITAKDQEFSITRINKSEVLKTLTAFKKDILADLTMMVHYYRSSYGQPRAVSGDDFIPGYFRSVQSNLGYRDDFAGI